MVEGIEGTVGRDHELEVISARPSSTDTVSAFSSGCQSKRTWTPSLSRTASLARLGGSGAHGSSLVEVHASTLGAVVLDGLVGEA